MSMQPASPKSTRIHINKGIILYLNYNLYILLLLLQNFYSVNVVFCMQLQNIQAVWQSFR